MAEPPDLVVGIGNTLRGDDGVGPWLAQRLQLAPWAQRLRPVVAVRIVQQLTPELSLELAEARRVLFVDAWLVPAPELRQGPTSPPPALADPRAADGAAEPALIPLQPASAVCGGLADIGAFSHVLDPALLLAITALLHGQVPQAWQLLVPAFRCHHGEGLSAEQQTLLPRAETLLQGWCSEQLAVTGSDAAVESRRWHA